MSEELSREDMLHIFNELVTNATKFIPNTLQQERDEAYKKNRANNQRIFLPEGEVK